MSTTDGQQVEMVYGPQGTNEVQVNTLAANLRAEEREVERDPDTLAKDRNDRVQRAFVKWHAEHPEVCDKLIVFARRYHAAGIRRGVRYFFEVMRHEHVMSGRDAQGFKLNNSFASRYARLIEREHDDLRGFFKKRQLRGVGVRSDAA